MGRDATRLRPRERQIGYVPQDGALFPTMTVRDNLGFALAIRGISAVAGRERVAELAEWLGVAHLLERKPAFLSGGEKQRVALGRAMACRPPILLFDEPLASLDDETRDRLVERLILLRQSRDFTVLHVTHSRSEAQRLGDCHFEIEGGSVRPIFPTNASGF
jgi:ABC-type sugar transport system ATPase subunit